MSRHAVYWVDTFAARALGGAPATVVLDADGLDATLMQRVAREFDVGETGFLMAPGAGSSAHARARIFTPVEERPYAGAPVLAMAFALVDAGRVPGEAGAATVRLALAAGEVAAEVSGAEGERRDVTLASLPPAFGPPVAPESVLPALGLAPDRALPRAPVQVVSTGTRQLLACLRTHADVEAAALSAEALAALRSEHEFASLRVFCLGGFTPEGDCYGRHFFAGANGVREDPFTGSSAGSMGAYLWHHRLVEGDRIVAEQGHGMGRPGRAVLERVGPVAAIAGVRVTGPVVALVRGTLTL